MPKKLKFPRAGRGKGGCLLATIGCPGSLGSLVTLGGLRGLRIVSRFLSAFKNCLGYRDFSWCCSHQCTYWSLQYCYFRSHWMRVKELVLCSRSYFGSYNNVWSCSMILHSRFSCTLYHNQDKWFLYIDVQSFYWLRVSKECSCLCCDSQTVELCVKLCIYSHSHSYA